MSLKIVVTWIENTRSGHWSQHGPLFDRIFRFEEIPSLKINAKLCFDQNYDSHPIFEIKVIEGFDKLKDFESLHINLECSSIRDCVLYKADTALSPSLKSVKIGYTGQGAWKGKNDETKGCNWPFKRITGNYWGHVLSVKPITYVIEFDLKLRKQEFKITSLSKRLSEKLFLNDELSDVKIHCHGKVFECHKVQYS